MDAKARAAPALSTSGGLGRLLDAEARLDRRVAEAVASAEAVVAAAKQEVAERLAEVEAGLAAVGREASATLDASSEARRAAIAARAESCCAHHERVMTEQLDRLTALVVEAVLSDAAEGGAA